MGLAGLLKEQQGSRQINRSFFAVAAGDSERVAIRGSVALVDRRREQWGRRQHRDQATCSAGDEVSFHGLPYGWGRKPRSSASCAVDPAAATMTIWF